MPPPVTPLKWRSRRSPILDIGRTGPGYIQHRQLQESETDPAGGLIPPCYITEPAPPEIPAVTRVGKFVAAVLTGGEAGSKEKSASDETPGGAGSKEENSSDETPGGGDAEPKNSSDANPGAGGAEPSNAAARAAAKFAAGAGGAGRPGAFADEAVVLPAGGLSGDVNVSVKIDHKPSGEGPGGEGPGGSSDKSSGEGPGGEGPGGSSNKSSGEQHDEVKYEGGSLANDDYKDEEKSGESSHHSEETEVESGKSSHHSDETGGKSLQHDEVYSSSPSEDSYEESGDSEDSDEESEDSEEEAQYNAALNDDVHSPSDGEHEPKCEGEVPLAKLGPLIIYGEASELYSILKKHCKKS